MKPIIVGIDPGTYVGIAIFDLNGNLLSSITLADKGKNAAVNEIVKHGSPIVVASDVNPPPELVTQIASYFNARLFYPKSNISDAAKTEETSKFKFSSVHERDAIIAVLYFFKENANKLRWIERVLRDKGLSNIEEDVKRYALSGMRVDDAIKALVPVEDVYKKVIEYARSLPDAPQVSRSGEIRESDRDTIIGLLESNIRMRARISVLEEEIKRFKSELNQPTDSKLKAMVFSQDMKIKRLKRIIKMKNKKIKYLYRLLDEIKKTKEKQTAQSENKITSKRIDMSNTSKNQESSKTNTETEKEKDLKNEDTTLIIEKIVKEYRESRFGKST